MANDIARHFEIYDEAEAVPAIVGHLRDFWTRAMIEQLRELALSDASALVPLAHKAIRAL
jgi:hypothetical protein